MFVTVIVAFTVTISPKQGFQKCAFDTNVKLQPLSWAHYSIGMKTFYSRGGIWIAWLLRGCLNIVSASASRLLQETLLAFVYKALSGCSFNASFVYDNRILDVKTGVGHYSNNGICSSLDLIKMYEINRSTTYHWLLRLS